MSSQEKTPQKSPVEKTPHPIFGLVKKTPNVIFKLVEKRIQEKTPHKMSSQEKTPQERTPQKSPVEKTPHPILGVVEKTPQLYKKPSFLKFGIFIHLHIENHI